MKPELLVKEFSIVPNPYWQENINRPLNLYRFLFAKASTIRSSDKLHEEIHEGKYGKPLLNRKPYLSTVKEAFQEKVDRGDSYRTLIAIVNAFKYYHDWAERKNKSFALRDQFSNYFEYSAFIQARIRRKEIDAKYGYEKLHLTSYSVNALHQKYCLENQLEVPRIGIFSLLGLDVVKVPKSKKWDKQNLEQTAKYGQTLNTISRQLSYVSVIGKLPIEVKVNGHRLELPRRLPKNKNDLTTSYGLYRKKRASIDASLSPQELMCRDGRYVLVNIRIHIEMLKFVIATGANRSVMRSLLRKDIKQIPAGKSQYQLRLKAYKARAMSNVNLQIFAEYWTILQEYLSFRDQVFCKEHESKWLFPSFTNKGNSVSDFSNPLLLHSFKEKIIIPLNIKYQGPRSLRKTRVNWLYRRSNDSDFTAQDAQHTKETLHREYLEPNHQATIAQVQKFWATFDPEKLSVAGGHCLGGPIPIETIPLNIAKPNCLTASGCFFCKHHRDIDTADYVWSLVSFRYLKHVEVCNGKLDAKAFLLEPSDEIISRITDILESFKVRREQWVINAIKLVEENIYHPMWEDTIDLIAGFNYDN